MLTRTQAADVLARYTAQGLTCRIIDKRNAKLDNGEYAAERHLNLNLIERICDG